MRIAWVAWVILLPLVMFAQDVSELPQYRSVAPQPYPYLISDAEGRFYARATPAENHGGTGITKVYRVGEASRDKLLATYKWYAEPRSVILCGNPDTNEVAVVLYNHSSGLDIENVENKTVLRFFAGGTSVITYRVKDLEQFGAKVKRLAPEQFYSPDYVVEGCLRVGESQYAFTLRTNSNKRIQFDILTGRRIQAQ